MTPVNVGKLHELLIESGYDKAEMQYLTEGFENGFSLEYEGPLRHRDVSDNIPLKQCLSGESDLWEKNDKKNKIKMICRTF